MGWLRTTAIIALVWCSMPRTAAAIGMCEPLLIDTWLIGVSTSRRQVALGYSAPTCEEIDDSETGLLGENWQSNTAIHIYDHRGKRVRVIKLKGDDDGSRHPYVVRNKFVKIAGSSLSPNKRCKIVGATSARMSIRRGRRTLFTKNLRDPSAHAVATAYWFAAGKLLVLGLDTTLNPGHAYAEYQSSTVQLLFARKHRLRRCF